MDIFFPIECNFGNKPNDGYGGPPVVDAGTIYIVRDEEDPMDWGDNAIEIVAKKTTLTEVVADALNGWENWHTKKTDDLHAPASKALAAALRAAADQLDAALPS